MKCRTCLDVGYIFFGPETIGGQEKIKCRDCMENKSMETHNKSHTEKYPLNAPGERGNEKIKTTFAIATTLFILTLPLIFSGCAKHHEVFRVEAMELHIVGNPSQMPAPFNYFPYAGQARDDRGKREIWIVCADIDGKYECSEGLLGHELMHHLNWLYPNRFRNPDAH